MNPTPSAPVLLPSTTTLSALPVSVAPTQPLMLTAGVTGAAPTGTVTFISAGVTLGTAPILNGHADTTVSFPDPGTYTVTASYVGDGNNQASSSSPLSITVAQIPSTTLLSVDTLTPGANQVFHFVVGFSGYSPTGTVTFLLADGTSIGTRRPSAVKPASPISSPSPAHTPSTRTMPETLPTCLASLLPSRSLSWLRTSLSPAPGTWQR